MTNGDGWGRQPPSFNLSAALSEWRDLQTRLKAMAVQEMALRKAIFAHCFPSAKEGTNTLAIGNGYELKADNKFNYSLDKAKINDVLDRIDLLGERAKLIAERLVKFSPELSLTEYRKITSADATEQDKAIASMINEILTIKPGAPTLEIKEPKA